MAQNSLALPCAPPIFDCIVPILALAKAIPSFSPSGKVFYASSPGRMTFQASQKHCLRRGAKLATTGQLYLAWREGLDQCDPGWLADGSVRYPIRIPRKKCGGDEPGVRTVYQFPNRTGFPDPTAKFDAYCYKGLGRVWGGGRVLWITFLSVICKALKEAHMGEHLMLSLAESEGKGLCSRIVSSA